MEVPPPPPQEEIKISVAEDSELVKASFVLCQIIHLKIVIFGLFDATEYILLQNFILLLYKKIIYEQRSDPSRLVFLSFTCYVNQIYKIEYRIAMKRETLDFHFQKCMG